MRIAIIGSGIAGLVAGYRLAQHGHELTLFEKQPTIGMDAHAATLEVDGTTVRADVPSRMFNSGLWPRLTRLYRELGVETVAVDTSQSLCDAKRECYMRSPSTLAAPDSSTTWIRENMSDIRTDTQRLRQQALRPRFGLSRNLTLQKWLEKRRFSADFVNGLLYPTLSSTVCTCSFQSVGNYPAKVVLETLRRMASVDELCRTKFGTREVVQGLASKFHETHTGQGVTHVRQDDQIAKVTITDNLRGNRGNGNGFDHVIVATQANTALQLTDCLPGERTALESFCYESIPVVVHRDPSLMPEDIRSWSTFNMMPAPGYGTSMCTVWLNRFHHDWPDVGPVFQTINAFAEIEPRHILASTELQRPVVNQRSLNGQKLLKQAHRDPERRIWFCGSFAGTGTPLLESAVESAEHVVRAIESLPQMATAR